MTAGALEIRLLRAGKRFESDWVFRHVLHSFSFGDRVAVLGPNGSGKSTFLQLVIGSLAASEGSVEWIAPNGPIDPGEVFSQVAFAAPYLEFPEELTLQELLEFHFSFKTVIGGLSSTELLAISGLAHASVRPIRTYSSGMKQRVRLLLACCSDTPLLVLDEPCSNLDRNSVEWYWSLLDRFSTGRTLLIGSNHLTDEYPICDKKVDLSSWKTPS